MLPLGRKNARKCSECDITCHANCAHLVPDFCGMSMETANQLLRQWRDINKDKVARGGKVATAPGPTTQIITTQQYQPSPGPMNDLPISQSMGQLKLTGAEPSEYMGRQQTPVVEGRPPDSRVQQQPPMAYPPVSLPAARPGGRLPPGYDQPGLPQPPRSSSYDMPPPGGPQYQVIFILADIVAGF